MYVQRICQISDLTPLAHQWNGLTHGNPMRGHEWLRAWWDTFGQGYEPYVLTVRNDGGELIGIAPWCRQRRPLGGRVLQFLGGGDACSDHLSLLVRTSMTDAVATAIANWLGAANSPSDDRLSSQDDRWDQIEWIGVDREDVPLRQLAVQLAARGHLQHDRDAPSCWVVRLPDTWDDFLHRLSKNHRKKLRRALAQLDMPGDGWNAERIQDLEEWQRRWPDLCRLHQRRRHSLGEQGLFDRPHFEGFLQRVAQSLLPSGQLALYWLTFQGRPAAFELQLQGTDTMYAYQSGMEPELANESPGTMLFAHTIRDATRRGMRYFDLLRGDESYKQRWMADRVDCREQRIVARHVSARIRHGLWLAGGQLKRRFWNRVSKRYSHQSDDTGTVHSALVPVHMDGLVDGRTRGAGALRLLSQGATS